MEKTVRRGPASVSVALLFALLLAACVVPVFSRHAFAYTPDSPTVRRLVDRAVGYLDTASHDQLGGKAVIALALLKAGKPADHPRIVDAAQAIRATVRGIGDPAELKIDIYSLGLSIIFLVAYDPGEFHPEIVALLEVLRAKQKRHGGWGYPGKKTGDTSMTQYGVLSTWEAKRNGGINVPIGMVDAVAAWLLKTQDPSGGFGYQGTVSSSFAPVHQSEVRHSMVVAGLGSVYLCADLLGVDSLVKEEQQSDQPSALRERKTGEGTGGRKLLTRLDPKLFHTAEGRGNAWMQKNYRIDPKGYTLYYIYGLERYASARQMAEGKVGSKKPLDGPAWYNDGVEYLAGTQKDDGTWSANCGKGVDTAFGVLFLKRSMLTSIEKSKGLGDGMLIGGRGLPKDGRDIWVRQGKVEKRPLLGPFEALQEAMKNADPAELAKTIGRMQELKPKESRLFVSENKKRLQQMIGRGKPEQRITAIKALARAGDLQNAPVLILALGDSDAGVVLEARDALRRISRKIGGFGLPDEFTPAQRTDAMNKWKAWYLAIRPDTEF